MTSLFIFYRCLKKALLKYNIVLKFAVIKLLIALHIAQGIAFNALIALGWISHKLETAEQRSIRMQVDSYLFAGFFLPDNALTSIS